MLAAWVGAAAVLLVGIGAVGVMGVRMMSQGNRSFLDTVIGRAKRRATPRVPARQRPRGAESVASSADEGRQLSAGPNYIVFNGVAYRLVGPSTLAERPAHAPRHDHHSLDGGATADARRDGRDRPAGVYVENDTGELLEFQPVERMFEGRTYQLHSADLAAFGVWPALPDRYRDADVGQWLADLHGRGCRRIGRDDLPRPPPRPSEGIAVAPGAPTGDPATGTPTGPGGRCRALTGERATG